MSIIDEMWQIHIRSFDNLDIKEPLYVNITGGLDSRVLAGVLRYLGYNIARGHYVYDDSTKHNIKHIEKIVKILNFQDFRFYEHPFKWVLKNPGSFIIHPFGNFTTGMYRNRKTLRNKWLSRQSKVFESVKYFSHVIRPFDNIFYVGYMTNLPLRWHFQQYGYIQMIKKYLPELYVIPRCFEKNQPPISLDYYPLRRVWSKCTHLINGR